MRARDSQLIYNRLVELDQVGWGFAEALLPQFSSLTKMAQGIGGRVTSKIEALNQPAAAAQALFTATSKQDYRKEGDFDAIKAPVTSVTPPMRSESYDPNTDAGFHVLRGIKNVTGIDLVDNYVNASPLEPNPDRHRCLRECECSCWWCARSGGEHR